MLPLTIGHLVWIGFVLVLPGYVAGLFARSYGWLVVVAWPPVYAYWDLHHAAGSEAWTPGALVASLLGTFDEPGSVILATLVFMVPTSLGFLAGIAVGARLRGTA